MSDIYLNITAEGAKINPQTIESDEYADYAFRALRGNNSVIQARVMGVGRVHYYLNEKTGQNFKDEQSIAIDFGETYGYVPLSYSGVPNKDGLERLRGRFISVVPLVANPNVNGERIFIFDRVKALETMKNANVDKIKPDVEWTAVVSRASRLGYFVNIGGFNAWLPNRLVSYDTHEPMTLGLGEMFPVKVLRRVNNRLIVSKRDAEPHPFDKAKNKYRTGFTYIAEIKNVRVNDAFGVLDETGIPVRLKKGEGRVLLHDGSKVVIRLTGKNDEEKLFEGRIESAI